MAVKLRLRRMGRKKRPVYGIVAADVRSPRDGRYIEDLGRYYPVEEPAVIKMNTDRIHYWLDAGAQPTDTVRNLLSREGILLERHLRKGGKSEEEIAERLRSWHAQKADKSVKETAASRKAAALAAEAKKVAEEEKERHAARAKAEAEAAERAKAEAEASRKRAEAELAEIREKAAEEAKAQQAEANVVEDAAAATEEAPTAKEAPAEEAPTAEPETTEEPAEEAAPEAAEPEAAAEAEEAAPEAEEAPTAEPEAAAEEEVAEPEAAVEEAPAKPDDLTKLWGIGPKFAAMLTESGITSYAALAGTDLEGLRGIIESSGIKQSIANEECWAEQAQFAANGDWDGLKAFIQKQKDSA